jgi:predicted phage terminase large subunit-like protein
VIAFDEARLTPAELAELDALLEDVPGEIPLAPLSFRAWIAQADPRFQFYRHVDAEIDLLQRVADGEISRVLIMMPPRHGKSEVVSRLFPGYLLYRRPDRFVGLCSYGAALAQKLSRAARERYVRAGGVLNPEAAAVQEWETRGGGGLWASGVGGPITGKGCHVGIVDDPVKNADDADSAIVQESQREWYDSTFRTRLEPDGAIVFSLTRWNLNDLAAHALASGDAAGETWHVLDLAAIEEPRAEILPPHAVRVPYDRVPGDALCPERYDVAALRAIQGGMSAYYWDALYQQRPVRRAGTLIKRAWITLIDALPAAKPLRRVRWWDHAGTDGGGDWTVGARLALHPEGRVVIEDVVRMQKSSGERDRIIQQTAAADARLGPVVTWREQEPGSAGKDAVAAFKALLKGYRTEAMPSTGSKLTRAEPFATACELGQVACLNADWTEAFLQEIALFPRGTHDDQVDAAASAYARLTDRARFVVPTQQPLHF